MAVGTVQSVTNYETAASILKAKNDKEKSAYITISTAENNSKSQAVSKTEQEVNAVKNIEWNRLEKEADSFIKEADKKETEKAEAKSAKKTINKDYKNIERKYSNTITNFIGFGLEKEQKEILAQLNDVFAQAKKLTSATASNTTVLESAKEFQSKLEKAEKDAKAFKAKADKKENKGSVVEADTARDKYEAENKITAEEIKDREEDIFKNNPFWDSALNTFEI